jgi:hypothetical protein
MMNYDRAVRKADLYTKMSLNKDFTYEPRIYKGDYNDCYVVQIYKGKAAGIAAY